MNPAVVVLGYDRPVALERLLRSVADAEYASSSSVPLVISVDQGGDPDVLRLARAFPWRHGEKEVTVAESHLGLVGHFHRAGALAERYGAIVLLEDDLMVSPAYYAFATGALKQYADDDRIAGVSLYALWFNGYNHLPFVPWLDDADVFFLQIPYYHGQAFTASQWARYAEWRNGCDPRPTPSDALHPLFLRFGADEWFPERTKYLVSTGRYFVFPRESLSTGFGDPGTHFVRPSRWFQASMQTTRTRHRFISFDESAAVYDSFYEMLPPRLSRLAAGADFEGCDVDLYGTKPPHALTRERVLTARASTAPLAEFGRVMWPMEANLVHRVSGGGITLSAANALRRGRWADVRIDAALHHYFSRGRRLSWRRALAYRLTSRVR